MHQEKSALARNIMKQEQIEEARTTVTAHIFIVSGVALLFIGSVITAILAFQAYQKVL